MSKRRRNIFIILGVLAVFVIGFFVMASGAPKPVITTDTVKRGDLVQTVEVTGEVKSIDEVSLAFNTSGVVASLPVKVGQAVVVGQVLASLKADDLAAAYARAIAVVSEAKARLQLQESGLSSEDRAAEEAPVAIAEAALRAAESARVSTDVVSAANVATVEANIAQTKTRVADDVVAARQNEVEVIRSLVAELRQALSEADTILGVENSLYNQEFRDELANEDTQLLPQAQTSFEDAAESRDEAEDAVVLMDVNSDTSISAVADLAYAGYQDVYATLILTSRVLDATSGNSADLSFDTLNTFKATISAASSSLVSAGSSLVSARQAKTDADRAVTDDVADAERALVEAEAARERDVTAAEATVVSRQADLARAEANLAAALATPRDVDLASYRAAVSQAQADASAALARLNNARILSPIAGTVTAVDIELGESASLGAPVITVLSSGQNYEVALDIPEADVNKIHVGQSADITFDAFGDDLVFAGSVSSIDLAEKVIEGVVFYAAKVMITADQDLSQVKPGMSATVTVKTSERTGVLYVPSRAVLEKDGVKFVRVPSDKTYIEQTVSIGLRADEGLTEIVNGLTEGQTIIVSIRQQ
ncbi:MAG: efflux RND transporter periplasmic adaptor subunit [Patescibacteria group bacterium]